MALLTSDSFAMSICCRTGCCCYIRILHIVLKCRTFQQCDLFVPTFNTFIYKPHLDFGKVYLKKAFVCLWSKLLKTCSPSKPRMHQIERKEQNNYMAVLNETVCLRSHNSFPFAQSNFQVPQLFYFPRTQWSLNSAFLWRLICLQNWYL